MRVTVDAAKQQHEVESDWPELIGSFSQSIDYAELRRRSAAASVVAASIRQPVPDSHSTSPPSSRSTMDARSSMSDSSQDMPRWQRCEPSTEQGILKSDPRAACYSPCSGLPSPSKHFRFCFTDPKSDCHRRVKQRRHRHHRVHRHPQGRRPDCVRFNASGPVPRQGLISFQYISKLFQPWLWRPSKRQRAPNSGSSVDSYDDDAGTSTMVIVGLVLVLIAIALYMSQNRDVWDNLSFELGSPSKVLGFENYLKNEVIDEMHEKSSCTDCKTEPKPEKVSTPPETGDSSSVGLEKYLRKKANRIISKLN